jgi:dolichyl-phosphate-mannose-protein mannosyltransferase
MVKASAPTMVAFRARARAVFRLPRSIGWRDHGIGAALAFGYVAALLMTAPSIGFTRDESFYFRAGTNYFGWWRLLFERGSAALSQAAIDAHWSDNHEHPALMKSLFGISWGLLHERWHVFRYASTAYRFPGMCTAGMAIWTTYIFGARIRSRSAGLVAATLLALMPRVFFHSHLACFDVPMMSMWLLCVYVHWRAQDRGGILWAIAAGIVFGLALETKLQAWFLPAVVVPHALFVHRRALLRGLRAGRLWIPTSLASMALLGPAVFIALWPYLYNDTLARIQWYVDFHLNHVYYGIEFLGHNYHSPPSPKMYLPVMVIATVPAVTLVLFGVGAADRAIAAGRRLRAWLLHRLRGEGESRLPFDRAEADLLLALALVVPMAPFFLSKTPIFGATKHWLPAYPFLALFAGRGFDLANAALLRAVPDLVGRGRLLAQAGLFASVVLAPLAITAHSTPFGLSTYVPLVGGTAGGADLGLNRQFWGYTSQDAATEYLNARAPRNATVFIHDTTYDAWARMQDEDRVRKDLRAVGAPHEAEIALVEHELHMNELDYAIWVAFATTSPTYIVTHDGVPIVSVYRR